MWCVVVVLGGVGCVAAKSVVSFFGRLFPWREAARGVQAFHQGTRDALWSPIHTQRP